MKKIVKLLIINLPIVVVIAALITFGGMAGCGMFGGTNCTAGYLNIVTFGISLFMAAIFFVPVMYLESLIIYIVRKKQNQENVPEWKQATKILGYITLAFVIYMGIGFIWTTISGVF